MRTTDRRNVFFAVTLAVAGAAWRADAAVVDLRAKARENPALIHHYTFEGPHQGPSGVATNLVHGDYLLDRKGGLNLVEVSSSPEDEAVYGPGLDALSRSGTGARNPTNVAATGSAWLTADPLEQTAEMTIECVLRPNALTTGSGYILGTRITTASLQRGYFLFINEDGYFSMRIGAAGAFTFHGPVDTSHWYYVAASYSVSDNKTTINAHVAELTAGGQPEHVLVNHLVNDYYLTSRLGIGTLYNGYSGQYYSPASIDEVAIYSAVLSPETIAEHFEALRRETPSVWYREIFPDDGGVIRNLPEEGWQCHSDLTANTTAGVLVMNAGTAFMEDVSPAGSFPTMGGSALGYLNNINGPTATNCIYWTEEMTNRVEFAWLRAVAFDARFVTAQSAHVAVRLDAAGTAGDTSDDVWYMATDFTNAVGTSSIVIPGGYSGPWWRYTLDMHTAEWAVLDLEPGVRLEPGVAQAVPPARALVTGFGLFHPEHVYQNNDRLDNYTLYVRKIYPPPGTMIRVF